MVMLLTDAQKEIYNLVATNQAFKNPQGSALSSLITACGSVISELPSLTFIPVTEQDDLEDALTNLQSAASSFLTHTNRVSGVIRLYSGTIPDIHQIFGVSRARQQLKLQFGLTEQQALSSGLELFGSLYIDTNTFTSMVSFVSTIIPRLQGTDPGPFIPPPPPNAQVPIVIDRLEDYTSYLSSAGNADNAAYNTALEELWTASMMYELSTFVTPSSTTENVVSDKIGTELLLESIEEQKSPVDDA